MEPTILANKLVQLEALDRDYKEALNMAETYRKQREELRRELLTEVPGLKYLQSTGGGKPSKSTVAAHARVTRITRATHLQAPAIRQKANDSNARRSEKAKSDTMAIIEKLGGRASTRQVCEAMGLGDGAAYQRLMMLVRAGKLYRIPNRFDRRGRPYVFIDERHLHALPKQEQDEARHTAHTLKTD